MYMYDQSREFDSHPYDPVLSSDGLLALLVNHTMHLLKLSIWVT